MDLLRLFLALMIGLMLSALGALVVMFLWNLVIPRIFNLPEISFWVSWGLCILLSLIFGTGK